MSLQGDQIFTGQQAYSCFDRLSRFFFLSKNIFFSFPFSLFTYFKKSHQQGEGLPTRRRASQPRLGRPSPDVAFAMAWVRSPLPDMVRATLAQARLALAGAVRATAAHRPLWQPLEKKIKKKKKKYIFGRLYSWLLAD